MCNLSRQSFIRIAVCVTAAAGSCKAFGQNSKISSTTSVYPRTVKIGQTYTFSLNVRNNNKSSVRIEARVNSVTGPDSLLDRGWQTRWLRPGESKRFSFRLLSRGGGGKIQGEFKSVTSNTCRYWVGNENLFVDRAARAVYRQFKNHHKTRSIKVIVYKRGRPIGASVTAAPGKMIRIWVGRTDEKIAWESLPWSCSY